MDIKDIELETLKILENKIRSNQSEERYYIRLVVLEIFGFLTISDYFQKIDYHLLVYFISIYPFLFLPILILEVHRIAEILAAGGYAKALENHINNKYKKNIVFWENNIVHRYLRDKIGSFIFWMSMIGLPIFVSIIMYIKGFKIVFLHNKMQYFYQNIYFDILILSVIFFVFFYGYVIYFNKDITNRIYDNSYEDATNLINQNTENKVV